MLPVSLLTVLSNTMDGFRSSAPGLYMFIILLLTVTSILAVGGLVFGIWKITEYERRRLLRNRFDSEDQEQGQTQEQELESPMIAT